MKVYHLIDSGGLYGAERVVLSLAKEQVNNGYEVSIISYGESGVAEKKLEAEAKKQGISCEVWRGKPLNTLAEFLKSVTQQSIFHSHGYKFNILLTMLLPYRKNHVFVSTVHGYTSAPPFSKLSVYYALNKLCLRWLSGAVFVSEQSALESKIHLDANTKIVIENGIPEKSEGTVESKYDGSNEYILSLGRLSKEKAVDNLIIAFSRLAEKNPDVDLVVAGEGPEDQALRKLAKSCGVSGRIHFLGYIDTPEKLIENARCLVMPSLQEGLPISLLEAMRAGIDILASRVGQIPMVLEHGVTGLLVTPGDTGELERALQLMLEEKKGLYGGAAKLAYASSYTSTVMFEKYDGWYERLVRAS